VDRPQAGPFFRLGGCGTVGYLRHSGLRTISGGIKWGGRRWLPLGRHERLLGYHRMRKSLVFSRSPSFFNLLNIGLLLCFPQGFTNHHPPPYRPNDRVTFVEKMQTGVLRLALGLCRGQGPIRIGRNGAQPLYRRLPAFSRTDERCRPDARSRGLRGFHSAMPGKDLDLRGLPAGAPCGPVALALQ